MRHPLNPDRQLFLSFDYCPIIKNVRNQFLDTKRIFRNAGVLIVPDYLRNLHDIQEKQAGAFKLVRLLWLENECLIYFDLWKESTAHKLEFLSEETYEALRVTTMSTVLCTRHLLGRGFHFVLTGKFSSDDVESLFSTIRQLNGSNDQTDAYAALSSLQKILVTDCIHSSTSGNVGSVIGSIGEATKLAPQPAAAAPPD
ncbi:hypothetical protein MRX96_044866 [Rhipicephalus microplus]